MAHIVVIIYCWVTVLRVGSESTWYMVLFVPSLGVPTVRAAGQGKTGSVFGFRYQQVIPRLPPTCRACNLFWLDSFCPCWAVLLVDLLRLAVGDLVDYKIFVGFMGFLTANTSSKKAEVLNHSWKDILQAHGEKYCTSCKVHKWEYQVHESYNSSWVNLKNVFSWLPLHMPNAS